ncbi:hypothetical protein SHELI_v1c07500 [Spiroplasma helicoides]|uniref:Lipoyl-binding domain-containing protein n=1 Tax=Spiroplasma helicoides TaxID=216938 RepID=A0A1B3SL93_9MOLU|nr:biotin/lipoyl-containing protein [Spiroplasma helicoides]AOG60699.1 hypothetical protein SHELI_v1c07500 [Spiroplasma helicoides]
MEKVKFKNSRKYKGIVESVLVSDGQPVKAGDLLAKVSTQVEKFEIKSPINGYIRNIYIIESLIVSHGDTLFDVINWRELDVLLRKPSEMNDTLKEGLENFNVIENLNRTETIEVDSEINNTYDLEELNSLEIESEDTTNDFEFNKESTIDEYINNEKELAHNNENKNDGDFEIKEDIETESSEVKDIDDEPIVIDEISIKETIIEDDESTKTFDFNDKKPFSIGEENNNKKISYEDNFSSINNNVVDAQGITKELDNLNSINFESFENSEKEYFLEKTIDTNEDTNFINKSPVLNKIDIEEALKHESQEPIVENSRSINVIEEKILKENNELKLANSELNEKSEKSIAHDEKSLNDAEKPEEQNKNYDFDRLSQKNDQSLIEEFNFEDLEQIDKKVEKVFAERPQFKEENHIKILEQQGSKLREDKDLLPNEFKKKHEEHHIDGKLKHTIEEMKRDIYKANKQVLYLKEKIRSPLFSMGKNQAVSEIHTQRKKINDLEIEIRNLNNLLQSSSTNLNNERVSINNSSRNVSVLNFEVDITGLLNLYALMEKSFSLKGIEFNLSSFYIKALRVVLDEFKELNLDGLKMISLGKKFKKLFEYKDISINKDDSILEISKRIIHSPFGQKTQKVVLLDLSDYNILSSNLQLANSSVISLAIGDVHSKVKGEMILSSYVNVTLSFDNNFIDLNKATLLVQEFNKIITNPGLLI